MKQLTKNEAKLLAYLNQKWVEGGTPDEMNLSTNEIVKDFKILKPTKVTTFSESPTSRQTIHNILRKLEALGWVDYITSDKLHPIIKIKVPK